MADDSAAHVSEEVTGAARAAPLAILLAVGGNSAFRLANCISPLRSRQSQVSDLLTTTTPIANGANCFSMSLGSMECLRYGVVLLSCR